MLAAISRGGRGAIRGEVEEQFVDPSAIQPDSILSIITSVFPAIRLLTHLVLPEGKTENLMHLMGPLLSDNFLSDLRDPGGKCSKQ